MHEKRSVKWMSQFPDPQPWITDLLFGAYLKNDWVTPIHKMSQNLYLAFIEFLLPPNLWCIWGNILVTLLVLCWLAERMEMHSKPLRWDKCLNTINKEIKKVTWSTHWKKQKLIRKRKSKQFKSKEKSQLCGPWDNYKCSPTGPDVTTNQKQDIDKSEIYYIS